MGEKFLSSAQNCVVIACCTTLGVFILGIAKLSGQLFVACMERYNAGRKDASFPFSLLYTISSVSGPLAGFWGQKYSAEEVSFLGCVLSIVGAGACFFAEDITVIVVLWGCVFGFGFGFGTILVPKILHGYFARHYDKAIGLYFGAASLSSVLFPPIAESVLNTYGTSGTFLLLSGLMMHCIPAALILRNFKQRRNLSKAKSYQTVTKDLANSIESFKDNKMNKIAIVTSMEEPNTSGYDPMSPEKDEQCKYLVKPQCLEDEPAATSEPDEAYEKVRNEHIIMAILRIFLDPSFIIISLYQCVTSFCFTAIWTVVVDYSRDAGVSTDQELLILLGLNIGDSVGRITLGFITDAGYMSRKNFSASCCMLSAISIWSLCEVHGLIQTMTAVCAIGLLIGGRVMISCGLVVLYIERDKVLLAFSCSFFIYPIFGFAQPYIIAYFRDIHGSYNGLFYLLAALSIVCSLLTMLLPFTVELKEKKRKLASERK